MRLNLVNPLRTKRRPFPSECLHLYDYDSTHKFGCSNAPKERKLSSSYEEPCSYVFEYSLAI